MSISSQKRAIGTRARAKQQLGQALTQSERINLTWLNKLEGRSPQLKESISRQVEARRRSIKYAGGTTASSGRGGTGTTRVYKGEIVGGRGFTPKYPSSQAAQQQTAQKQTVAQYVAKGGALPGTKTERERVLQQQEARIHIAKKYGLKTTAEYLAAGGYLPGTKTEAEALQQQKQAEVYLLSKKQPKEAQKQAMAPPKQTVTKTIPKDVDIKQRGQFTTEPEDITKEREDKFKGYTYIKPTYELTEYERPTDPIAYLRDLSQRERSEFIKSERYKKSGSGLSGEAFIYTFAAGFLGPIVNPYGYVKGVYGLVKGLVTDPRGTITSITQEATINPEGFAGELAGQIALFKSIQVVASKSPVKFEVESYKFSVEGGGKVTVKTAGVKVGSEGFVAGRKVTVDPSIIDVSTGKPINIKVAESVPFSTDPYSVYSIGSKSYSATLSSTRLGGLKQPIPFSDLSGSPTQPLTASGGKAIRTGVIDYSPSEIVRVESGVKLAYSLGTEKGLPVKEFVINIEGVKDAPRVSKIVEAFVGEEGIIYGSLVTKQLPGAKASIGEPTPIPENVFYHGTTKGEVSTILKEGLLTSKSEAGWVTDAVFLTKDYSVASAFGEVVEVKLTPKQLKIALESKEEVTGTTTKEGKEIDFSGEEYILQEDIKPSQISKVSIGGETVQTQPYTLDYLKDVRTDGKVALRSFQNIKQGDIDIQFPDLTVAEIKPRVEALTKQLQAKGEDVRISPTGKGTIIEFVPETPGAQGKKFIEVKSGIDQEAAGLADEAPAAFLGIQFPNIKAGQSGATVPFGKTSAIRPGEQLERKVAGATIMSSGEPGETPAFSEAGVLGKQGNIRGLKDTAGAVQQAAGIIQIKESSFNPLARIKAARAKPELSKFLGSYTPEQQADILTKLDEITGSGEGVKIKLDPSGSSTPTDTTSPSIIILPSKVSGGVSPYPISPSPTPPSIDLGPRVSKSPLPLSPKELSEVKSYIGSPISPTPSSSMSPGMISPVSKIPSPSRSSSSGAGGSPYPLSPSPSPTPPSPIPSPSPTPPSPSPITSPSPSPTPPSPVPSFIPKQTPKTKPKYSPFLSTKQDRKKGAYEILVRREGLFKRIGTAVTAEKAVALGKQRVEHTAAASFKIKPIGSRSTESVSAAASRLLPRANFYESKKETLTFIEKKERRIKTHGEKREITAKGIFATRSKKRKGIFGGL